MLRSGLFLRRRVFRPVFAPIACLAFLTVSTALIACAETQKAPKTQAEYQADAERAWQEAEAEFQARNFEYATQLMEDVRRNYGYTPYARKAHLRLGDIAFELNKYPEAVAEYKAYVHDHPNDAQVPYARLQVIKAQFAQSSGSIFQPPVEERDLAPTRDAYTAVRAFLADYPNYEPREELEFIYKSVSGMLARHELYVARFYLKQDRFHAAMRRAQFALRTFSNSGLEPEATVLLGEIYLKMKDYRKAEAMFARVLDAHPDSAFSVPAQHFLEHMDAAGLKGQ